MNERIKELLAQAYDEAVPETWTTLSSEQQGRIYDKFAELIVRECIEQLEIGKSCDPYTGELFSCDRNDNIDFEIAVLKEHFGVDE